jgi:hypothetical protein
MDDESVGWEGGSSTSISKYSGKTALHGSLMFQEAIPCDPCDKLLALLLIASFSDAKPSCSPHLHIYSLQTQEPKYPSYSTIRARLTHTQEHIVLQLTQLAEHPQIGLLRLDKRLCHHHDVEIHGALRLCDIDRGTEVLQLQHAHQQRCAWGMASSGLLTRWTWDRGIVTRHSPHSVPCPGRRRLRLL